MNDQPKTNEQLPEHDAALQTTVIPEPNYEAFGVWMDGELEKLVERWIHLAAPNASRQSRRISR